jgi:predicted transcriptional regulator
MQRRDSTCIFYDILFLARKGVTKTRTRRELGLTFRRCEERLGFLLERGFLDKEWNDEAETYTTTKIGYRLLYFISRIEEELGGFFPNRKGKCFVGMRGVEVDKELMEFLFDSVTESKQRLNRNPPVGSMLATVSPSSGDSFGAHRHRTVVV